MKLMNGWDKESEVDATDRQDFAGLYECYYRRLFVFLLHCIGRREMVEHVLHDVMIVVWNHAARLDHVSRLSIWLFGIAYRKAMKALAYTAEQSSARQPTTPEAHGHTCLAKAMISQETSSTLTHALRRLSPEQRAVVTLTFSQGFSYSEIAAITGCPVTTVKTRMVQARRHLSQLIGARGVETEDRA